MLKHTTSDSIMLITQYIPTPGAAVEKMESFLLEVGFISDQHQENLSRGDKSKVYRDLLLNWRNSFEVTYENNMDERTYVLKCSPERIIENLTVRFRPIEDGLGRLLEHIRCQLTTLEHRNYREDVVKPMAALGIFTWESLRDVKSTLQQPPELFVESFYKAL